MLPPKSGKLENLVILLHGYGSDGNDMISLGSFWRDILPNAQFIAPNAPTPCAINPAGYEWFPLAVDGGVDFEKNISRLDGSIAARPIISNFLTELWRETGLGAKDTIVVGFSQGAMMALEVGLRLDEPLMGIVAFSGGLPTKDNMDEEIKSKPPICFVHGGNDDVVPVGMSVTSSEELKKLGLNTRLHISPGATHTIAQDGLEFANSFIQEISK